jgi:D-3-phosphoglycerate dehydrogenase
VNLEGHRSVGGMRASIYNAMPIEGVDASSQFMRTSRASQRMTYRILTLNNISVARGSSACRASVTRWPRSIASAGCDPGALGRHAHDDAGHGARRGRAGAGVNNVPVAALSKRGIPVFNAPGANANAVKELVLAGMFLAARNICQAWNFARACRATMQGDRQGGREGQEELRRFRTPGPHAGRDRPRRHRRRGGELRARARHEACSATIRRSPCSAPGSCRRASSRRCRSMICSRGRHHHRARAAAGCDARARECRAAEADAGRRRRAQFRAWRRSSMKALWSPALDAGHLHAYMCAISRRTGAEGSSQGGDAAASRRLHHEAEENCAVMVADNLRDYLENGNVIRNSVNFPEAVLPRTTPGTVRLAIANSNVPNMVGQISTCLADAAAEHRRPAEQVARRSTPTPDRCWTGPEGRRCSPSIRGIDGVLSARCLNEQPG